MPGEGGVIEAPTTGGLYLVCRLPICLTPPPESFSILKESVGKGICPAGEDTKTPHILLRDFQLHLGGSPRQVQDTSRLPFPGKFILDFKGHPTCSLLHRKKDFAGDT